jgi:uncharacterized lipoprotein YajG
MSRNAKTLFVLIIFSLSVASCSGGTNRATSSKTDSGSIQKTINIPNIPPIPRPSQPLNLAFKPYLIVDTIEDARESAAMMDFKGKKVKAKGDITLYIQYALRQAFRVRGFSISDQAPVTLGGSIKKWIAYYKNDAVICEAVLELHVKDPSNQVIYSGSYDGFVQLDANAGEDENTQVALGQAMHNAMLQVVNDQQLITVLTSF